MTLNGALAGMVGSHHYRSVLVNIIMTETNMIIIINIKKSTRWPSALVATSTNRGPPW